MLDGASTYACCAIQYNETEVPMGSSKLRVDGCFFGVFHFILFEVLL